MKKYQCNACENNICTAEYQGGISVPFKCTHNFMPHWKEIEPEVVNLQPKVAPLPDWCKVGEWVFDTKVNKYIKVPKEDIEKYSAHVCFRISSGEILQARLRPYNAEDMQELVGKVLEYDSNRDLVTSYDGECEVVYADSGWMNSDELLSNGYTIDGKPCGVLEHLEDGEWVN